jgi:hypothetical protein
MNSDTTERAFFTAALIDNATQIEIDWVRENADSTADDIIIEWYVVEYSSASMSQDVERGVSSNTSDPSSITLTGTVDEDRTLYFGNHRTDLRQDPADSPTGYATSLTGGSAAARTTLTWDYASAPGASDSTIAWQVVEFLDADVNTQHGETSFTDTSTQSITAVTLTDSMVLSTGYRGGSTSGIGRGYGRVGFNSNVQLQLDVCDVGTGGTTNYSWSVLEILDGGSVDQGEVAIADASATPTQPTFTAKDENLTSTVVANSQFHNVFNNDTTDITDLGSIQVTTRVASGAAGMTITRTDTTRALEFGWNAIEWAPNITRDVKAFRFYEDGTESGSTAIDAQNTNISESQETTFQIRVGMQAGGDPPTETAQLRYRRVGTTPWRVVKDA